MEDSKRTGRRRHSSDLKSKVVVACAENGASVAQVALAHGLNANLVHKWRRQAGGVDVVAAAVRQADAFIPMTLAPNAARPAGDIRIELRRGASAVSVTWPLAAAAASAAWLRELLK